MSNYEIMLIIDPNCDDKIINEIANKTFKSKAKIEKLERTELAYEINKSKTANYYLINVSATGDEINEFTRKANITKTIWRILSINLDSEKGLNRKTKPKKVRMSSFNKKTNNSNEAQNTEEIKTKKTSKPRKSTKTAEVVLDKEEKPKKTSRTKKEKSEE